jgi:hypothetical protein
MTDCIIKNTHLPDGKTLQQAGAQQGDCCVVNPQLAKCDILCDNKPCQFWPDLGLDVAWGNECTNTTKTSCDPNDQGSCTVACARFENTTVGTHAIDTMHHSIRS